jgi:hypothetical protein
MPVDLGSAYIPAIFLAGPTLRFESIEQSYSYMAVSGIAMLGAALPFFPRPTEISGEQNSRAIRVGIAAMRVSVRPGTS